MTNLQFMSLLIPAVGSFILVILAWLHQNTRLTDLRSEVYRGLDQLGKQVNERFNGVDRRLDFVDARLDKVEGHLSRIDQDLRNFHGTDKELEGRVNELSARINRA